MLEEKQHFQMYTHLHNSPMKENTVRKIRKYAPNKNINKNYNLWNKGLLFTQKLVTFHVYFRK
jgi:hypothetical protein